MAIVTGTPFRVKDATIMFGADNFESMVSEARLVPAASQSSFTAINGRKLTMQGPSAWTLQLTFAQDWTSTNSLSKYLFTNEGSKVTVKVYPNGPTGTGKPIFTVDVWLTAGDISSAADTDAMATVSLGCDGKPVLTAV